LVLSLAILRKPTLCSAILRGSLVEAKYNPAAEIGLDRKLLHNPGYFQPGLPRSSTSLDPVYQQLVILLGIPEAAKDLTQEVFLRYAELAYAEGPAPIIRAEVAVDGG
jgi:hypothetical protein